MVFQIVCRETDMLLLNNVGQHLVELLAHIMKL